MRSRQQAVLRLQRLPGDDVEIAQADALEAGGLVELDKCGQRLVQHPGKRLPAGVGQGGQGDEVPGEVQLPPAVLREEVIVGNGGLGLPAFPLPFWGAGHPASGRTGGTPPGCVPENRPVPRC